MVVVTEVVLAQRATILMSRGKNAQIDLQVQGNIRASSVHFTLLIFIVTFILVR
jgi:hypothetical protein